LKGVEVPLHTRKWLQVRRHVAPDVIQIIAFIGDRNFHVVFPKLNDFEAMWLVKRDHTKQADIEEPKIKVGVPGAQQKCIYVHSSVIKLTLRTN